MFGELTYHNYCDPRRSIPRDQRWKCVVNFTTSHHFMNTAEYYPKAHTRHPIDPLKGHPPTVALYDLDTDPLEEHDLADMTEHVETKQRLLTTLRTWMTDTDDPLLQGIPTPHAHRLAMQALGMAAENP